MQNRAKTAVSREAPRRFLFDQSFDVARKSTKKPKPEDEKPPEPTFSREELEAARQEGYARGREAGSEEAASGFEASISRLVAAIGEQLPVLSAAQAKANKRLLHDGAQLTTTIARKILPAFTARHGIEELDALVAQCLRTLIAQPKITIRVDAPNVAAITERLELAASASAFDGRFVVEADETMGPSDCRITWQGGGLERREAEIWREVEAATERFLGQSAQNGVDDARNGEDGTATPETDDTLTDDALINAAEGPTDMPDPLEDR